jgi:hypothetical protein
MVCAVILFVKAARVPAVSDLLWAEDADTFLYLANNVGAVSLLLPYSGYLHALVRLANLAASCFDAAWQPAAVCAASLVFYGLTVWMVMTTLASLDVHRLFAPVVAVLLVLQPLHDELLFCLTNTQWFTGFALSVYALGCQKQGSTLRNAAIGVLFGLSGPFCIFLMPLLAIKRFVLKNRVNSALSLFLAAAALIQLAALLLSREQRILEGGMEKSPQVVMEAATALGLGCLFNLELSWRALPIAVILAGLVGLWLYRVGRERLNTENSVVAGLVTTAFILYAGGVFSMISKTPEYYIWELEEAFANMRYVFVPHSLLIVACFVAARRSLIAGGVFTVSFLALFAADFAFLHRDSTHFQSFVNFSNFQPVNVTTNPLVTAQGTSLWFMPLERNTYRPLEPDRIIRPEGVTALSADTGVTGGADDFTVTFPKGGRAELAFNGTLVECPGAQDIGLTFRFRETSAVKLSFSIRSRESGGRVEGGTLYHNFVEESLQMAFPHIGEKAQLRLDLEGRVPAGQTPPETVSVTVGDLTLHCLPPS